MAEFGVLDERVWHTPRITLDLDIAMTKWAESLGDCNLKLCVRVRLSETVRC